MLAIYPPSFLSYCETMGDVASRSDYGSQALDRALTLFASVLKDRGRTSLATLAQRKKIPPSTAHRLIAAFERQGLVMRSTRGHYVAGMRMLELTPDRRQILIHASRVSLCRLARETKRTAHLGILETDMVTYLVKAGGTRVPVFTREMIQLEAYCTGIGKVLLAGLAPSALDRYLSGGSFVPLTPTTLTAPKQIRAALQTIARTGYAVDNAEMVEGLHCVAVPIRDVMGRTIAAISLASTMETATDMPLLLNALAQTAHAIERKLVRAQEYRGG